MSVDPVDLIGGLATTDNVSKEDFRSYEKVRNIGIMATVAEVNDTDLDVANGFDCIRLGTGNATNATCHALYILWPAKYGKTTPVSAILD